MGTSAGAFQLMTKPVSLGFGYDKMYPARAPGMPVHLSLGSLLAFATPPAVSVGSSWYLGGVNVMQTIDSAPERRALQLVSGVHAQRHTGFIR